MAEIPAYHPYNIVPCVGAVLFIIQKEIHQSFIFCRDLAFRPVLWHVQMDCPGQIKLILTVCRRFNPFVIMDRNLSTVRPFLLKGNEFLHSFRVIDSNPFLGVIDGNRSQLWGKVVPDGGFTVPETSGLGKKVIPNVLTETCMIPGFFSDIRDNL